MNIDSVVAQGHSLSCSDYRRSTTPMLRLFKKYGDEMRSSLEKLDSSLIGKWDAIEAKLRRACR